MIFFGKYEVVREIGRGGMGVVYLALDRTLDRHVAIKSLHAHLTGDESFMERFFREARAMARLQHENIIAIFSVESEHNSPVMIMEYFESQSLRYVLREGSSTLGQVVKMAIQIAEALGYAHGQGIVHRDVKPGNVLIAKSGKVKLADFGIAAALDESSLTATGQVIGTPEYMAPEQARGEALDGRSDLYAVGIVLYEMLVGHTPFHGVSKTAILGKLLHDRDGVPLVFPQSIPRAVRSIVQYLVRKDPAQRLPDAATLVSALREVLEHMSPEQLATTLIVSESTTLVETEKVSIGSDVHAAQVSSRISAGEATQISRRKEPTGFFELSSVFRPSDFFSDDSARFKKILENFRFYREQLGSEYETLLRQARTTYVLWCICTSLGFFVVLGGIIAMLMGLLKEGLITVGAGTTVYFIQKLFHEREDHYRALATQKREHLQYGDQWLLAIQTIDAIGDPQQKRRSQARLVQVLTEKLKARQ